ncbi:class-II fumarase/aspartase family protein [Actinoplanes friuliensis]|uniref:Adenylosuccinate lyase n=1 Tax=Actinoplanes friuliensis DSM 7358 TaxID=1246995 RepID=U5VZN6_9ACTN|nr:adenylosuccinate lyase family protein [Actinoplanes friuliensis]AGZ41106.1 adenylosuccinate lyase [Actinoplanes friuliensis DSM 7358]
MPEGRDGAIADLFGITARRQRYLDVEAALARAQGALGIIPADAADRISASAQLSLMDDERIDAGQARTGHTLVPLIEELDRVAGDPYGGYVHWGATTQNIQQTGDVLMLRDAHGMIVELLRQILLELSELGERTAGLVMPARTHWQHAVPMTFGLKVAAWSDVLIRHLERLGECRPRLLTCMVGGAAGTFGSLGAPGRQVQALVAADLGLTEMPVPARNITDHFAELVSVLGMLAATCSGLADEVSRLMAEEFGEVSEGIPAGDVGSSTMPQKRNPKISQGIVSDAAQVRALVPLALDAMMQSHEVDGARSAMMDRAVEGACRLSYAMLTGVHDLLAGLEIFPDRMAHNLTLTNGLINAENVMMHLAPRLGRQQAHGVVRDAAARAGSGETTFLAALTADPRVTEVCRPAEVAQLLDPSTYVGLSEELARETSARARAAATSH